MKTNITIYYKSNCIYLPQFMDNIDMKINARSIQVSPFREKNKYVELNLVFATSQIRL